MKLTTFLLIIALVQASAKGFAQRITLNETNAPLEKVINTIKQQSGYTFLFTDQELTKDKITVKVNNASIDEALKACFQNTNVEYKIVGNNILLKTADLSLLDNLKNKIKAELAQITIQGKVVDETGKPLPGVTVREKETNTSSATEPNGNFAMTVKSGSSTITFSSIGYDSQELLAKEIGTQAIITLKASVTNLREIMVNQGYYTRKQELNTGNVTRVDGTDIAKQPGIDPIEALEGKVPGLYIQQSSGIPGSNPIVRLRGQNSIANGNDPLYIIDGVPFSSTTLTNTAVGGGAQGNPNGGPGNGLSPFNSLDGSNIASIEILKDADATSIYGSRGANGVILITTKRGKPGKTIANIDISQGVGNVASMFDLMNTQQYIAMRNQAYKNDGLITPSIKTTSTNTAYDINGFWDQTSYTNWQKVFIGGTAQYTNLQGSISGGTVNTQFNVGGGFRRQTTVFPGDYNDQNGTAHFNLSHVSTNQKFHAQFSAQYSNDANLVPNLDFTNYILLAPNAPALYNADGSINWGVTPSGQSSFGSQIAQTLKTDKATTNSLISNMVLSYEILPGLQVKSSFGYTRIEMNQTNLQPAAAIFGTPNPLNRTNNNSTSNDDTWIIEPQINYQKQIGKGKIDLLVGLSEEKENSSSISYREAGYTSDALINNPAFASSFSLTSNNVSQYRHAAVYARVGYNWMDKYLLNITARRDGSSRFGPDNLFGNFGAVGGAWIFTKEKFANDISWLSFGKLRASYGTTGNDQIGNYQYLSAYSAYYYPYQGISTLFPTAIANPYYGWEVIKKLEGGFELGFLKDRINLQVDYFRNRSGNQLVGEPLPTIDGFTTIIANLPAIVQNTGLEIQLNTTNIKTAHFTWSSALNITSSRNKLISFPGLADNPNYSPFYAIGQPIVGNPRKVYHYTGVDPQTGIYTFQDVNGDGILDNSDKQSPSNPPTQNYYGGLDNRLSYMGFSIDIFFQFVKQRGFNYLNNFSTFGIINQNLPVFASNNWQKTGDNSGIEKYSSGTVASQALLAYGNLRNSDAAYTDASFIRLKNIELSYRLPTSWQEKLHVQNVRIFLLGQNLLTVTKFQGLDPESQNLRLPPLRMITAGLNISL